MRIKFIQDIIDNLRDKNYTPKKVKFNNFQKEIIACIKKYQSQNIKFPVLNTKKEFKNFTWLRAPWHTMDSLGGLATKGDKIYKLVYEKSANDFIELYETGILQAFADFGIMPKFKITNYTAEGFPIIFEIEKLHCVRAYFWSYFHVKEDAKLKLMMIEILNHFGYTLLDGHMLNTVFIQNKPVFVDFGSIIKGVCNKDAFRETYSYNILSLIMMSLKKCFFSRYFLSTNFHHFIEPGVDFDKSFEAKWIVKKFTNISNFLTIHRIVKKRFLKSADIDYLFKDDKYLTKTLWSNYCCGLEDYEKNEPIDRYMKVIDCINKYSPDAKSSLDLAGNSGYFSYLIKTRTDIERVISTDYDSMAIEYGIRTMKNNAPDLYVLNFMKPQIPKEFIEEQLKSDVAVALAVTHHLILTQKYDIDYIFETIKSLSNEYVYIEFCPMGLYAGTDKHLPEIPSWYTTEWFEEHFKKHFKFLHKEVVATRVVENSEHDWRVLFVGKI